MKGLWSLMLRSHLILTGAVDLALVTLAMLSGILVARLLGPAGRGEYAVAILWPSVIVALGTLGVREALTYEQARASYPPPMLVGTAMVLAGVQSILLVGLGWLLIPLLTNAQNPGVTHASLLFLLVIPTNLVAQYGLGLLQGSLEISAFNALRLTVSIFYLAAVLIIWLLDAATIWNLTLGLLVANACTALATLTVVLRRIGIKLSVDITLFRRILGYGLRNHVGSISSMLNQRADQMLMAILITPKQLGWYVVAVSVSSLTRLASNTFATLTFPKVAGATPTEQRRLTGLYSRLNAMTTLSLGLVLMLLIPGLVPLVYGREYSASIVPAEILVVATLFVAIGQAWAGSLRGLGRPSEPAKAEIISLVVTVVGLALLLKPLGIIGAALTSLAAYLVAAAYMYLQLRLHLAVGLRELLWPVSLATIRERLGT